MAHAACLLISVFPLRQNGKSNFWHVSTRGSQSDSEEGQMGVECPAR